MKRLGLTILILVLFLLLAACAQKSAPAVPVLTPAAPVSTPLITASIVTPTPTVAAGFAVWGPWDSIVARARQEGKLTVYTAPGHASPPTQQAWNQLLQEKFGIAVEWVATNGGMSSASRVLTEQQTRTYVADILLDGYGTVSDALVPKDAVQSILAPATLEKDVWRVDPGVLNPKTRFWLYINIPIAAAIVVNTNLIKPGEEPQSYQDLLDPKWKGKISMMTPAQGGSGSGWFRSNYKTLGLDYMRKLAPQVVLWNTTGEEVQAVARGQFPIVVGPSVATAQSLIDKGAPMKYVHLKEGDYAAAQGIYLVSNGPHPNAAKLFINWLFTQEGQNFYAKSQGVVSVRKDVSQDWVNPDLRFDPARPLLLTSPDDATVGRGAELAAMGKQIFEDLK